MEASYSVCRMPITRSEIACEWGKRVSENAHLPWVREVSRGGGVDINTSGTGRCAEPPTARLRLLVADGAGLDQLVPVDLQG